MWFIKSIGEFENGVQMPVIADLSGNFLHATTFFEYFSGVPTFDTYDLLLSKDETPGITMEDILNAISKKEKEVDFSTA